MRVPKGKNNRLEFKDLLTIYSPEREALCVDTHGNILANHTIGTLCKSPVTEYGAREVLEYTARECDIFVRFAGGAASE